MLEDFETALKTCRENKEGFYRDGSSKQACVEDSSALLNGFGKLGQKWHKKGSHA